MPLAFPTLDDLMAAVYRAADRFPWEPLPKPEIEKAALSKRERKNFAAAGLISIFPGDFAPTLETRGSNRRNRTIVVAFRWPDTGVAPHYADNAAWFNAIEHFAEWMLGEALDGPEARCIGATCIPYTPERLHEDGLNVAQVSLTYSMQAPGRG